MIVCRLQVSGSSYCSALARIQSYQFPTCCACIVFNALVEQHQQHLSDRLKDASLLSAPESPISASLFSFLELNVRYLLALASPIICDEDQLSFFRSSTNKRI